MGGAFGNFSLGPITPGASAAEKKPSVGSVRGESRFKNLLSKSSSEDVNSVGKEKQSTTGLGRLSETEDDSSHPVPDQVAQGRAARSGTNPFFEPRSGSAALGGEEAPSSTGIEQFAPSSIGFPSSTGASNFQDLMPTSQQPALQPPPNRETASPTNTNPYQSPQRGQQLNQGDLGAETSDFRQAHLPDLSELHDDAGNATFLAYLQRGSAAEDPLGDRSQTSSAGANRGFSGLGPLMHSLSSSGGGWPPVASTAPGDTANCGSAFPATFGDPIFGSMADLQSPNLSTLGAGSFFGSHTGGAAPGFAGAGNRPSKLHSLFPPAMQDQMRDDQSRQELPSNEGVAQPQGPTLPEGAAMSNQQGAPPMVQVPSGAAPGQGVTTSIGQSHFEQPSQIPQNAAPQPNAANSQLPPAQQRQMVMPDRMRWIYRDPQGATQGPFSGLEMHDWFKAGFFTADLQVKKVEDTEYEPLATLIRRIGNSREPFLVPQIGVPHGVPSQPNNGWSGSGGSGGGGSAPAAAAAPAAPAATSGGGGGPNGGVQPPFPSSFPNFGTTLTAEQQNALERRKQEEQYLMARQKEHLQQHQTMMKQMSMPSMPSIPPPPMHPQQLQHHGSGHSLNSQPSYGSITSPTGGMPPPMQAPIQPPQQPQAMPGYYEQPPLMRQNTMPNLTPQMHPPDVARGSQEDLPTMMDRMNVNPSAPQPPFAGGAEQPENTLHSQQVAAMLQDRARLQQEQEQFDMNNQTDSIFDQHAREERLRQFHALRGSSDEELAARRADGLPTHPAGPPDDARQLQQQQYQYQQGGEILESGYEIQRDQEPTLSLAQQVQKTASDQLQQQQQQAQSAAGQTESPWKVETGMPQPFPPPPRTLESPLPAPSPQRSRQNVADALAAEMRSESQASAEAPPTSIAPWAKEHNEAPKGPSLKEIQEAEARQAAKMEEAASAARRAHAEQEHAAAAAADQGTSPAPGLPSTANWASGGSAPAAPATGTGSAWTKPLAGRAQPSSNQGVPKKTLAQIQKEEEARKQRQTGAAATATNNTHGAMPSPAAAPAVKRYADLAGKATPPSTAAATATAPTAASSVGDAWTTVGAGGKPKAPPPAPAPAPAPTVQRSVTAAASSVATAAGKPYPPAAPTRSATLGSGATAPNPGKAMEELTKWAKMMLGRGLNNSINGKLAPLPFTFYLFLLVVFFLRSANVCSGCLVGDFVQQLQILPAEVEIISDSVYANSQTLDGRRFAEEYVRRRNLAERGIMDTSAPSAGSFGPSTEQASSSSGWNEVAKKGPSNANHDDDSDSAAFKVVAGKKKGKR